MKKLCSTDRAISVNISLPSEIVKSIDDYAERSKCSRSVLIRSALLQAFNISLKDEVDYLDETTLKILTCIYEDEVKQNGNK